MPGLIGNVSDDREPLVEFVDGGEPVEERQSRIAGRLQGHHPSLGGHVEDRHSKASPTSAPSPAA